jgi:hypothetical protein
MDFVFRFRDHVLSHTVYKPGGVTETSHCCLSSYHNLQVSRLCYIIVACPLTTTSRASQLHTDMVCKCVNVSGERVLEQALDPDRWAVQSLHVLDDSGVALQHKWGPDCKACLMCTCSSPMWAVQAVFWGTGPTPLLLSSSTTPRRKSQS